MTLLIIVCLAPLAHSTYLAISEYKQRNAWPPRKTGIVVEDVGETF